MDKNQLIKNLLNFDREVDMLYGTSELTFKCYIVGGGALVLTDYVSRVTHDVDILKAVPDAIIPLMAKYDMNMNVSAHICSFADDCYLRAKKLDIGSRCVEFYTLSLEDLVVSKLAAARDKDLEDISRPEIIANLNWTLLDEIIETAEEGILSDWDRQALKTIYKNYKEDFYSEDTDI